ncbi:FliO/MopB family protein [Paraconexibacter sp.]|uniref:FliO/MopB family protein n=1 Tax=Paraconexibacter sp. TaxID=2949640 RepID=UPI00356927EA
MLGTLQRAATTAALLLLAAAPAAFAAPGSSATGEDAPLNLPTEAARNQAGTAGSTSGSLVRTVVGLAVVIGVIYGLSWVMRQVKASREEATGGHGLRSAATIALGPNRSLHLVHAGRELVLVGVAEQGVTPIRTYSRDEAVELGLLDEEDLDDAQDGTSVGPRRRTARYDGIGYVLDALRRRTQR